MLPALLVVLLAVLLAYQAVLPREVPVPLDLPPARVTRLADLPAPASARYSILDQRSIFAPLAAAAGADAGEGAANAPPPLPLDGAVVAGIVRVRGAARLVLQSPEGRSITLRPGQSYRGWRLLGIASDSGRFRRGGETIRLEIGAEAGFDSSAYSPPNFGQESRGGTYRPYQADEQ